MDHLSYTYSSTIPNQLASVGEINDATHLTNGFMNPLFVSGTYSYDVNGNLTADPYKGITQIAYNYLNKTDKITLSASSYINYTYDGAGVLIRKQQTAGSTVTTTDYVDGFVYIKVGTAASALSYFPMPEGRVLYNGGTCAPEFIMTDPQGNARISFQNNGGTAKVVQENSYYPTGLILQNSPVALPTTPNKQLYNGGSEWQNDFGNLPDYYETYFRNYDAAIARWVAIDPQAESAESMTPYQYAGDNPVMSNDPMGNKILVNPIDYPNYYRPPQGNGGSYDMFANADAIQSDVNADIAEANAWQTQSDFANAVEWYNSFLTARSGNGDLNDIQKDWFGPLPSNTGQMASAPTGTPGNGPVMENFYTGGPSYDDNYDWGDPDPELGKFHAVRQLYDGQEGGLIKVDRAAASAAGITILRYEKSPYGGVRINLGFKNTGQYDSRHFTTVQVVTATDNGVTSTFIDMDHDAIFPFTYSIQTQWLRLNHDPNFVGKGFDGDFYDEPHRSTPKNGDSWFGTLFIIQTTQGGNNNVVFTFHYGFTYTDGKINPIPLTGN